MNGEKQSAPELAGSKGADQVTSKTKHSKIRVDSKLGRVVQHLVEGKTLHRFQAEKICHDHVLPSTVLVQRESEFSSSQLRDNPNQRLPRL